MVALAASSLAPNAMRGDAEGRGKQDRRAIWLLAHRMPFAIQSRT
jgi:hypothetical protein